MNENNQPQNEQKADTLKRGRRRITGRDEKFTLYMTKERMSNLKALTRNRDITITDLLNNLIDEYCAKQSRYIEAIKELEEKGKALETLIVE